MKHSEVYIFTYLFFPNLNNSYLFLFKYSHHHYISFYFESPKYSSLFPQTIFLN